MMKVSKTGFLACLFLSGLFTAQSVFAQEGTAVDLKTSIQQQAANYAAAFNQQDAKTIAAFWASGGEYQNLTSGAKVEGRDNIASSLETFFADHPKARLVLQLNSVKPVTESVARGEGTSQLLLADGTNSLTTFTVLYVKQGENWLVESLTESESRTLTSTEALQELNWLIGTWEDETDDVVAQTSCKWSRTNAFLIRTFHIQRGEHEAIEGTQIIGWDPLYRQIRSWNFYSDGSFGSGFWSKNGDDWLVKTTQTLVDGRIAQGTQVFSDISSHSMTVQLTSYSIEGEFQPSRDPVVVVRVEEEAETAETPAQQGGQQ